MQKFFIDHSPPQSGSFTLTGEACRHFRVLRLRKGDRVTLCDGSNTDFFCTIAELSGDAAVLNIDECCPGKTEPTIKAHVYVALPKGDKLEHIIQKSVELGASSITVFSSGFCVSKLDSTSISKKTERWNKISEAAAGQCGRGIIPKVSYIGDFTSAMKEAAACDLSLLLYENEADTSFKSVLSKNLFSSVAIVSGPEGGFSAGEVQRAAELGLVSVSLGARILRCETAPLAALSALMYHTDNF